MAEIEIGCCHLRAQAHVEPDHDVGIEMKPHPEPILKVCETLNKQPETCVMIGDFPQDIQAGKAAGTKTVAILGVNAKYTKNRIRELEPDVTLFSFGELLPLFLGPQLDI